MPISIIRLLAFDGPNICGPQPGVLLHAQANRDRSARMKAALKDAAQSVGIVIGGLKVVASAADAQFLLTATFVTPTPALGAATVRYVVDGLNARERNDEGWDAEGELWELQKRRRAEALPVATLQLLAEARARGVPAFVTAGKLLQIGYGARGMLVTPEQPTGSRPADDLLAQGAPFARAPQATDIAWGGLGAVPIVAVIGGTEARDVVREAAERLRARGQHVISGSDLSFDAARELLGTQQAEAFVLGLAAGEVLERGLPFVGCAASTILGPAPTEPSGASGRQEQAQALGVAMLVTAANGIALLDAGTPEIAGLAAYAPCRVELVRAGETSPAELAQILIDGL